MRSFLIICFYSLFLGATFSQLNLIRNPSFEQFDSCTAYYNNINILEFWRNANNGSPDYFNTCNLFPVSNPLNGAGYQLPSDSNGYVGIGHIDALDAREAIQGVLISPLQKDKYYCFEMFIAIGDIMYYSVNEISIYFSPDTILGSDFNYNNFGLIPQLNIDISSFQDTMTWLKVSGGYNANGGERHLLISSFQNLIWTKFRDSPFNDKVAYYYIDQVSLIECEYPNYMIPGGFSPNGDGVNDYFEILNLDSYPQNSLQVLNRWGDLVYTASPYNNQWDGTANTGIRLGSGKVTDGTYFYVFSPSPGALPIKGALEIRNSH